MNRIKRVSPDYYEEGYSFKCPGCQHTHIIPVKMGANAIQRRGGTALEWGFNGNLEQPTFTPSLLVQGTEHLSDEQYQRIMAGEKVEVKKLVCHSFIRDGKIQFLGDCTHALANQTVDLPEIKPVDVA